MSLEFVHDGKPLDHPRVAFRGIRFAYLPAEDANQFFENSGPVLAMELLHVEMCCDAHRSEGKFPPLALNMSNAAMVVAAIERNVRNAGGWDLFLAMKDRHEATVRDRLQRERP